MTPKINEFIALRWIPHCPLLQFLERELTYDDIVTFEQRCRSCQYFIKFEENTLHCGFPENAYTIHIEKAKKKYLEKEATKKS